jgi:hypothetical protein
MSAAGASVLSTLPAMLQSEMEVEALEVRNCDLKCGALQLSAMSTSF